MFFVIPVLFPALTSQNVCCEKDLLIEGGRLRNALETQRPISDLG